MMSHHRQFNNFRVSSHPAQPVVAQDSKHAYFQHQVSRTAKTANKMLVSSALSANWLHSLPLLVPANGDICAYRRWLIVLHPGCEVEQARQQQVDEGHQHRDSQKAGLMQGVTDSRIITLLQVLLGREPKQISWTNLSSQLDDVLKTYCWLLCHLPAVGNDFLNCHRFLLLYSF